MKLICRLLGHKYRIIKEYSPEIRKLKCARCGCIFGMHDGVHALVLWDRDMESAHRIMFPEMVDRHGDGDVLTWKPSKKNEEYK